ncbi:MAG: methyltransferase family protein [Rhizomicrobium sp.]
MASMTSRPDPNGGICAGQPSLPGILGCRSQDSRFRDLLCGLPLMLFCGFGLAGFVIQLPHQLRAAHPDYSLILTECASGLFLALQLILLLIRRLPCAKAQGYAPRLWALAGANFGYALLLLPKMPLGGGPAFVSLFLVLAGTLGSVAVLGWLGRGFSIFPQARQLVRNGPYAFVRHPLYILEQIAMLGMALQFLEPWALIFVAISFALQFPRMDYEEKVLAKAFPEYEDYARAVPRLIPFLLPRKEKRARA